MRVLTYCVVNTAQRELLMRGLDAIAGERERTPFKTRTLVLDNASPDGSVAAVRSRADANEIELIELRRRRGKAANDSQLMQRTSTRYSLLLNEDSELLPGASEALVAALEGDPHAACAGAQLLRPDGTEQPCAWRFPGVRSALFAAIGLHRRYTVQSFTAGPVDWAQSSALLVRRDAAEQVGWMDPEFFVYSDEVDFQKRLFDAGWHTLFVPAARAFHHEQLATGAVPERRIIEHARGRDRYMRKHHGVLSAALVRWLTSFTYLVRALVALVLPGHDPRRYLRHATAAAHPDRGEGLRELAERA